MGPSNPQPDSTTDQTPEESTENNPTTDQSISQRNRLPLYRWDALSSLVSVEDLRLGKRPRTMAEITQGEGPRYDEPYPPDFYLNLPWKFTFTQFMISAILILIFVDFLRVGFPSTPIPYNYPLFLGIIYLIAAIFGIKLVYQRVTDAVTEFMYIIARSPEDPLNESKVSDISVKQVNDESTRILRRVFHPFGMVVGGIINGLLVLIAIQYLGIENIFPYTLFNLLYGFGHGIYWWPVVGLLWFGFRASTDYVVDIDVLSPDGMGGYREIGNVIVSISIYVIAFATWDFLILSSATFTGNFAFQLTALLFYLGMISLQLGIVVIGTIIIRQRLLTVKEARMEALRVSFREIEARYWEKQQKGEDPYPETEHLRTMDAMFTQMQNIDLWPINFIALGKLGVSLLISGIVVGLQIGLIPLPQ